MKFIFYRNAKHLRAEGIGESIRQKLRDLSRKPRFRIGSTGIALA